MRNFQKYLHKTLLAAVLPAVLLLAPNSAHAQAWRLNSTVEQAQAQAATYLKDGKNQQAYDLYMALMREIPEDVDVSLGLARAASAIGEYNQAVLALERVVDEYPQDAGLRAWLARTHYLAGNAAAAKQELDYARTLDPNLTTDLAEKVLDKLERETRRWQVSGRLSAGVVYDSNVNMGPQSAFMQLGIWDLRLDESATEQSSWGAYGTASLDGGWRLGPESPWWLVGDVGLYRKGYFSDLPTSRELGWARAAAGIRYLGSSALFDLRFKTDAADYVSDDQLLTSNGPELLLLWAFTPNVQLMTRASLERRDYRNLTGRQGWYFWAGEYVRVLFGQSAHSVTVGGRVFHADAANNNYDWTGYEASVQSTFNLPFALEFSPFITWRNERYKGPATALELKDRKDDNLRVGASLSWYMTKALSWDVMWQYSKNNSTSPLYDYDQQMVSAGVTWRF